MKILEAFSKFAHEYNQYNVIQKDVAKKLISYFQKRNYKKVLDLGSGDGEVYRNLVDNNIEVEEFVALDFSEKMLEIHPGGEFVRKVCLDFNKVDTLSKISSDKFDVLISSSALQWSEDLSSVLSHLSSLANEYYFSFFTSNTFRRIHKTAKISSPIYSKKEIINALNRTFIYEFEVKSYQLEFKSVHEMLRYIKKSGVSGGVEQLSYRQMKTLMLEYPLSYLEFEVMFVKVTGKLENIAFQ